MYSFLYHSVLSMELALFLILTSSHPVIPESNLQSRCSNEYLNKFLHPVTGNVPYPLLEDLYFIVSYFPKRVEGNLYLNRSSQLLCNPRQHSSRSTSNTCSHSGRCSRRYAGVSLSHRIQSGKVQEQPGEPTSLLTAQRRGYICCRRCMLSNWA